jgi:2,3-bisphosphoglycerate-dependent phosphoglycerate mutase
MIAALIRHGDYQQMANTPSALQPWPLTANGVRQAESVARELVVLCGQYNCTLASRIDSSRLLRAWQTADIISRQLYRDRQVDLRIDSFDELAERSVGSVANLSIEQIEAVLEQDPRYRAPPADWKADSYYQLPFPGAESLLQAGQRVAAHLHSQMHKLQHTATVDTIKLFVGHGAAFRHAAWQLGVLAFDDIAKLSMYHARPVLLEYQADGGWRHLAGDWKQRKASEEHRD